MMFYNVLMLLAFFLIAGGPAAQAFEKYQEIGLKLTNIYRANHNAPPMTLDESVCSIAEKCAKYYALEKGYIDYTCPHKGGLMGENLCSMGSRDGMPLSPDYDARKVTEVIFPDWYGEMCRYTFGVDTYVNPSSGKLAGHFKKMVWKESTKFCVAVHRNVNETLAVIAAIYEPKSMKVGAEPENVLPAVKSIVTNCDEVAASGAKPRFIEGLTDGIDSAASTNVSPLFCVALALLLSLVLFHSQ